MKQITQIVKTQETKKESRLSRFLKSFSSSKETREQKLQKIKNDFMQKVNPADGYSSEDISRALDSFFNNTLLTKTSNIK